MCRASSCKTCCKIVQSKQEFWYFTICLSLWELHGIRDVVVMGEIAEQSLSKFLCFLPSCYFIHKAWNRYNYWGVFRTLPNIYDGAFYEQQLTALSPELFSLCFTFIKASSLIFDIALNTPVSFKDNSWYYNTDYNRAIHLLI